MALEWTVEFGRSMASDHIIYCIPVLFLSSLFIAIRGQVENAYKAFRFHNPKLAEATNANVEFIKSAFN